MTKKIATPKQAIAPFQVSFISFNPVSHVTSGIGLGFLLRAWGMLVSEQERFKRKRWSKVTTCLLKYAGSSSCNGLAFCRLRLLKLEKRTVYIFIKLIYYASSTQYGAFIQAQLYPKKKVMQCMSLVVASLKHWSQESEQSYPASAAMPTNSSLAYLLGLHFCALLWRNLILLLQKDRRESD